MAKLLWVPIDVSDIQMLKEGLEKGQGGLNVFFREAEMTASSG